MPITKMQFQRWQRLIEAGDPTVQDYSEGPSPGGAAAELGITRQAVHKAIHRGELDVLAVYRGDRLSHYTISVSSLKAYKELVRQRAAQQLQSISRRLA